ncbi:hypothetical protein PHISP_03486 [Aspergillus sp. HF37]|nr:hypothetical protein PHISP_03486 [Aspergillus sp. HF37]
MLSSRRAVPLLGLGSFFLFLYFLRSLSKQWHSVPQFVGLGDLVPTATRSPLHSSNDSTPASYPTQQPYAPRPHYALGTPKPPGSTYTKTVVVPKTKEDDTSWMDLEINEWQKAVYAVDDPSAPLHPPKNKGHEVMVYLSYIIDHYGNLPDIVAFMHSHQFAWHNDDLFDMNAATLLRRLNPARVVREGYMNLRCNWGPGCPDWMHPGALEEDVSKQEETMLARAWGEIFPDDPIPAVLAQPCCAQFAVSRERILAIPKARFVFYRDWMLRTELSDYISGRVWEYLWHVVFTGENTVCPTENVCYCDGYGICFGGEEEYADFRAIGTDRAALDQELNEWLDQAQTIEVARIEGPLSEELRIPIPEPGKDVWLREQMIEKDLMFNERKNQAIERGNDPRLRALEAGREWHEGDGF